MWFSKHTDVVVLLAIIGVFQLLPLAIQAIPEGIRELRRELRIRRSKKLAVLIGKIEPVLYYNQIGGTTALCRVPDFKTSASGAQRSLQPWESLKQVRVRPTFVFCQDEFSRTKMHVDANEEQVREIADVLVKRATGYTREKVTEESFDKTAKALIRRNNKLFVPFSTDLSTEDGKSQAEFYGGTRSFPEVREYLLR